MTYRYYELPKIPDLTLSKYESQNESGVDGVLKQHRSFWRLLNRRGRLMHEGYQLFYEYDPERPIGKRLRIGLRIDSSREAPAYIDETIASSPISPYFGLVPMKEEDAENLAYRRYRYTAHLLKDEHFLDSSDPEDPTRYYMISQWEMNEGSRLYSMMKLMTAINKPCLYCVSVYPLDMSMQIRQDLGVILPALRDKTRIQVRRNAAAVGMADKDENAKSALDAYEDLIEDLDTTPHFLVDVQVLSDDPDLASYVLDTAASEALEEGSHDIYCTQENNFLANIVRERFESSASGDAPDDLLYLPHLHLLEEVSSFAVFPTLYPGEFVDCPKETLPKLEPNGLMLGEDEEGHTIRFPLKNLSKHAFLAGVPGSGKTNSMMHLITSMHVGYKIPVLILEPAKHEYRVLTSVPGMEDVALFSPSARTPFPLHINPFQFPVGMTLAEHIRNLMSVFEGAFTLEPPMPFLLDSSVDEVYRDHNWLPAMVNKGDLTYPTMKELYKKLEQKLEETDYGDEVRGNLKSALQVRIGSLLTREMGDVFDVPYSSIAPEQWLKQSAIIELESMGPGPANFLTLMLSTLIRETLKIETYQKPEDGRPRHVMFFEEAHNLIGPESVPQPGANADPKVAATAFVVKMLAEVRALGEGIVIADQLPTAMAPEIIKNTSLKIGLRITAQDDRSLLGGTMSADGVQLERMGVFSPGHALCSYEPLLKPFEIQIPEFKFKENNGETEHLLQYLVDRKVYMDNLERSLDISLGKWDRRLKKLKKDDSVFKTKVAEVEKKKEALLKELEGGAPADQKRIAAIKVQREQLFKERDRLIQEAQDCILEINAYQSMTMIARAEAGRRGLPAPEAEFYRRYGQRIDQALRERAAYYKEFKHRIAELTYELGTKQAQRVEVCMRQFFN